MFEGKSIFEILQMGGWTLYVLIGASVLSVTVIIFKLVEFWGKSKTKRTVVSVEDVLTISKSKTFSQYQCCIGCCVFHESQVDLIKTAPSQK